MAVKLKERSILNFSKYCMICAGIWRLPLPTQSISRIKLYGFYSAFVQVYFVTILISMGVQFALVLTDQNADKSPEKLFKQLSDIIPLVVVEFASILCQGDKVKQIVSYIIAEEEDIARSRDRDILQSYNKQARFCKITNTAIFTFTLGTGSCMILENFWRQLKIAKYNAEQNASLAKPFPFELYCYKLNKQEHAMFLLLVNDVSIIINVFLIISTKLIFISCIIFVPSVLKKLQIEFVKMASYNKDVFATLRSLIRKHLRTIEFVKELNDSIKYLILMEYLLNSLNVAAVSIQFITYDRKMLASPIFYFSFLFVQTFVLGWSANELQVQSSALAEALYNSPWYEQNKKVKKALLTMLIRCQRPLTLTIGPFDAMTTQSALMIMKASYSYVTLMMNNYN
ncbi:odorant receptor 45b-like [Cylas formicarius]|uniref:odorant receptor 45b-like n=1 Tax=Cylas formicarius TaxID=197179 RepID=UPI0029589084|nr:odorant receptor 45b-like [Cylas formicarius]